ncbi:MAG: hypothetical protein GY708_13740 [Actinomycetia bacterium]|nr:hypothetical protein [Actinomycetes bacterium]MCP4958252.1 hypothetical protein [Actinomycetes bacterium]
MTILDTVKEAQTRSLDTVKSVQDQVASLNERVADSVHETVPSFDAPFAEYLPKPAEVVENYFSFMSMVHEANRDFATRLVGIWNREIEDEVAEEK